MKQAVKVVVSGRVQGVGFRFATQAKVMELGGVTGYVRNLSDGRVEALFVGKSSVVEALVAWCRQGPPRAEVTGVQQEKVVSPPEEPTDFKILPDENSRGGLPHE